MEKKKGGNTKDALAGRRAVFQALSRRGAISVTGVIEAWRVGNGALLLQLPGQSNY